MHEIFQSPGALLFLAWQLAYRTMGRNSSVCANRQTPYPAETRRLNPWSKVLKKGMDFGALNKPPNLDSTEKI